MSDKITRKDLKRPDDFLLFTGKAYNWVHENPRTVLYGIIILFVIVIGSVLIVNHGKRVESKAANILFEADRDYKMLIQEKDGGEKNTDREKAIKAIDKVISEYPSSDSAVLAYFYKANILYDAKEFKEAIDLYKKAQKGFKNNDRARALVLLNIAYSFEGLKDEKSACDYFQQASKIEKAPSRDVIFYEAGSCLAGLGKKEEAKNYYKMLISDYPDSKLKDQLGTFVN